MLPTFQRWIAFRGDRLHEQTAQHCFAGFGFRKTLFARPVDVEEGCCWRQFAAIVSQSLWLRDARTPRRLVSLYSWYWWRRFWLICQFSVTLSTQPRMAHSWSYPLLFSTQLPLIDLQSFFWALPAHSSPASAWSSHKIPGCPWWSWPRRARSRHQRLFLGTTWGHRPWYSYSTTWWCWYPAWKSPFSKRDPSWRTIAACFVCRTG